MLPVFVSFFTETYATEAAELIRTLDAHRLVYDVRSVPGRGSWVRNCAMKSEFIRDRMLDHPAQPLVWLDSDARVMKSPGLFTDLICDFAAHLKGGSELLSGTMYFGPTPNAWKLVQAWVAECQRSPEVWDQKSLQKVLPTIDGLEGIILPPNYTAIFDAGMCPAGEEVILHTQASRRLRH